MPSIPVASPSGTIFLKHRALLSTQILNTRIRIGEQLRPLLIHRGSQLCLDAISASGAIFISCLLRFDFDVPVMLHATLFLWMIAMAAVYPIILWSTRAYQATWQFFGLRDLGGLLLRTLPCMALLLLARAISAVPGALPYSVALIWFGIAVGLSSSFRLARRLDHEALLHRQQHRRRTLLVGTDTSLAGAVRQLSTFGECQLVGLVADNLTGITIAGVRVLGQCSDVLKLILSQKIDVVMASEAALPCISALAETCSLLDVEFRLLPSAHDLAKDNVRVIRKVSPLSIRPNSAKDDEQLAPEVIDCLAGQVVLVTGAGGSIGSELARQIATAPIKKMVVLDQDENSIFELMNEIGKLGPIVPYIADIRNSDSIRSIFSQHMPDVVFHAAAYKHVPLMEQNPCEAVITNVMGTYELARAAMDVGTKRFVLISTDKAVKPSSIMGASKRVAEMTVQLCAEEAISDSNLQKTQFACVRFGNVLGSRGSVLPTFLKQIAAGGPITVTNTEMTRYFMTIPQAVRLVMQAGTLASQGDIYMLDMGNPVRIMDFLRDVVHASGLVLNRDIEVKVVGTRPGEKLHEQLWNEGDTVTPTSFPELYRVHVAALPSSVAGEIADLIAAAQDRRSDDVRASMQTMSVDYDMKRAYIEKSLVTA